MVATRWPKFISPTATCMAMVDFPAPPFSFPMTMTCADVGRSLLACINMRTTSLGLLVFSASSVSNWGKLDLCSSIRGYSRRALLQGADAVGERALGVFSSCADRGDGRTADARPGQCRDELGCRAGYHGIH